jgi:hypothetical protein
MGGRWRAVRGVALIASLLGVSACGGAGAPTPRSHARAHFSAASSPGRATLQSAIAAPPVKLLHRGEDYHVSKKTLDDRGWQVSCESGGRRVNAEQVRGQRTGTGEVISTAHNGPSIWVVRNHDGSLTIECR